MPDDHIAHLFYLAQNAVVKASAPYPGKPDAPIENFVETLLRMKQVLLDCEARVAASAMSRKANGLPPPLVLSPAASQQVKYKITKRKLSSKQLQKPCGIVVLKVS